MTGAPAEHRRVVLLDKDGTLVHDVPYNVDPRRIRLAPGAAEGVRRLTRAGYRLAVVSNQAGVALGRFPESALSGVHDQLQRLLAVCGAALDGFFYCPHHPAGTVAVYTGSCGCRKPAPGMLTRAMRRLGADPAHCWMVGDILDDVEAGNRAGCRTVLLDNGHETEWRDGPRRRPDLVALDLAHAAALIIVHDATAPAGSAPA